MHREGGLRVPRIFPKELGPSFLSKGLHKNSVLDCLRGEARLLPGKGREAFRKFSNNRGGGGYDLDIICNRKQDPPSIDGV